MQYSHIFSNPRSPIQVQRTDQEYARRLRSQALFFNSSRSANEPMESGRLETKRWKRQRKDETRIKGIEKGRKESKRRKIFDPIRRREPPTTPRGIETHARRIFNEG